MQVRLFFLSSPALSFAAASGCTHSESSLVSFWTSRLLPILKLLTSSSFRPATGLPCEISHQELYAEKFTLSMRLSHPRSRKAYVQTTNRDILGRVHRIEAHSYIEVYSF